MRISGFALAIALPLHSVPANADPVSVIVDTGSHTCTSQGQEKKTPGVAVSGSDRYFDEATVSFTEISKFLAGGCSITSVEKRKITVKLENGTTVAVDVPVKYHLLAVGDCTSNLGNIGKRMGTECRFSANTIEHK
ncbi:MAG: hypothetical protein NW205_10115 [Hyphomicrobiaceae bacterium]|nr:hypothetical protein [Hyphomicrobiaceae bacterium]